ncbi:hypothetical protein [Cohnella panacarvi]|uniref:hypothetical protein n=1 Tax=Cohnella panacarvi TaxID=400776 RepID=UPI00047CBC9F|nr:hypothetical protein [Cohnella panacarvi]
MTTTYPELNDLVRIMEGRPSTNGWDVVCSYTVKQLNDFLESQYQAGKLAKDVVLSTVRVDPIWSDNFEIQYDIRFASPVLSFITGRSGFAMLTMPINEGSIVTIITKDKKREIQIPGGKYSVQAIVPLAAIKGDTGEVIEYDNVVTFSDGNPHDNHIIVHFKSEKGTLYQIVPAPDPQDQDILVTYFLPVLKEYFQTNIRAIDYALSSINNKRPQSGETILTPKSFVFASTGDGDDGVLSLYIQTNESGNPPGNPSPSFQPGDVASCPVPNGYTASIILSNRLMTQSFLKRQLEASGFSVELSNPVSGGGVSAILRKNQNIFAIGESEQSFFENHSYDGLQISMQDNPVHMTLQNGGITLAFGGSTRSMWSQNRVFQRSGTWGGVYISLGLHKGPIPLTLSENDVIESRVSVGASDFNVGLNAYGCDVWESMNGCSKSYPSFYDGLSKKLQIPSIDLNLPGLDFFNTTNLLAPGQNVINLDTSKGVLTPHDFLVVGNVANLSQLRKQRNGAV